MGEAEVKARIKAELKAGKSPEQIKAELRGGGKGQEDTRGLLVVMAPFVLVIAICVIYFVVTYVLPWWETVKGAI